MRAMSSLGRKTGRDWLGENNLKMRVADWLGRTNEADSEQVWRWAKEGKAAKEQKWKSLKSKVYNSVKS